jgi:hypothetical protein
MRQKTASVKGILQKKAPKQREYIRHNCSYLLPSGTGHQELYVCQSCDLRYRPSQLKDSSSVVCTHCVQTCHKGHIVVRLHTKDVVGKDLMCQVSITRVHSNFSVASSVVFTIHWWTRPISPSITTTKNPLLFTNVPALLSWVLLHRSQARPQGPHRASYWNFS